MGRSQTSNFEGSAPASPRTCKSPPMVIAIARSRSSRHHLRSTAYVWALRRIRRVVQRWRVKFGCHRDQRGEAKRLLRTVSSANKNRRIGWIRNYWKMETHFCNSAYYSLCSNCLEELFLYIDLVIHILFLGTVCSALSAHLLCSSAHVIYVHLLIPSAYALCIKHGRHRSCLLQLIHVMKRWT